MGLLTRLLRRDPKAQLRAVLGDYELPSFSGVIVRTRELIRSEAADNGDIAESLMRDPGMSARVLRTVNSAAFGMRRRVDSVEQATALLGRAQLETMLLAHGVAKALPRPRQGLDMRMFWNAAARRAMVARELAERLHPASAAACFTGALLQDLAVPVLANVMGDSYAETLEASKGAGRTFADLERERFGWDHADVGSWICDTWAFPDALTVVIGAHHGTSAALGEPPPAIVTVGLMSDDPHPEETDRMVAHVEHAYGLPADDIAQIVAAANDGAYELAKQFG